MPVGPTTTGTGLSSVISAEVPCQLLPLDQEPSRTAVRAGDRFLRRLEISQQPALLGDIKCVTESHRGMARERRGRLLDCTIAPVLGERRQDFLDGARRRKSMRLPPFPLGASDTDRFRRAPLAPPAAGPQTPHPRRENEPLSSRDAR